MPARGASGRLMQVLEVFADVSCPFAHAGLQRFRSYRQQLARTEPVLRVRAWPLELVNGRALDGPSLRPKITALRADVASELFTGFDEHRFPTTTLPAMAAEAAAYRHGVQIGEQLSFAVRRALFEDGLDVSDASVLHALLEHLGIGEPTDDDRQAVRDDLAEGKRRGVAGSPHFFTADGAFFCPSLDIQHDDDGYEVSFDAAGFQEFVTAVFA